MKEARGWGSLAILSLLILGIGGAMAIPEFGCGNINANSTAAIATMRNLVSCQAQFKSLTRCDVDGDGIGEFGTFGEMTGAIGPRGDPRGRVRREPVAPPDLSPALANANADGVVVKSGYAFRIFLPAKGGVAAHEGRAGFRDPIDRPVDTDAAETEWCAYAWPVSDGTKDHRAFFVTGTGESWDVWQSANTDLRYFREGNGPAWDGAFPAGSGDDWRAPASGKSYSGRDGNEWKPTN